MNILKLEDLFKMKITSLMWDFENSRLPSCFPDYFQHAKSVHNYKTRFSAKNKFSKTRNLNSTRYGIENFSNIAINDISNNLKDFSWYHNVKTKKAMMAKLKNVLCEAHQALTS